jgi:hypothetical protein
VKALEYTIPDLSERYRAIKQPTASPRTPIVSNAPSCLIARRNSFSIGSNAQDGPATVIRDHRALAQQRRLGRDLLMIIRSSTSAQ